MSRSPQSIHFKTLPGLVRAFRRWADESKVVAAPDVLGASAGEQHVLGALGGIAAAVAGDHIDGWPEALRQWAEEAPIPPEEIVEAVRERLGARADPLSALYDASISATHRRRLGTVFTPAPLVDHMIDLAAKALRGSPACVLDPGAGVGAFTVEAAVRWPDAHVVAVDVNVVTLGLLATRIAFEIDADSDSSDALQRIELVLGDYLEQLEDRFKTSSASPILTLGNPPYTRIQEMSRVYRDKAAGFCGDIIDNGHANLAVLFQAATLNYMRDGDVSCMVLPGSLGYTRASRGLRRELWRSQRPIRMERTPATTRPFAGRSVQAAILVVGSLEMKQSTLKLARVHIEGKSVAVVDEWERARSEDEPDNWFWATQTDAIDDTVRLSNIAQVRRGVATGASSMFFLTDADAAQMPTEIITTAVPTLRQFAHDELDKQAHLAWGDARTRRWLLAIPPGFKIEGVLSAYINQFEEDVSNRYLPSQRQPWYSLTNLLRPDILVAPLSKNQFKIVLNSLGAVPSNNLLGVTMLNGTDPRRVADWLRSEAGQRELRRVSRRYHGGSHKLEPGDLQRLPVPAWLASQ